MSSRSIFHKLNVAFWKIANRDHIPPLPYGMLRVDYDELPPDAQRVVARMAARDDIGTHVLMKRLNITDIDELVATLEHYEARHWLRRRISAGLGRMIGSLPYRPHRLELIQAARADRRRARHPELNARLKRLVKEMNE